jgi:hypothetical protein
MTLDQYPIVVGRCGLFINICIMIDSTAIYDQYYLYKNINFEFLFSNIIIKNKITQKLFLICILMEVVSIVKEHDDGTSTLNTFIVFIQKIENDS